LVDVGFELARALARGRGSDLCDRALRLQDKVSIGAGHANQKWLLGSQI
jgi:hypothetical protein